MSNQYKVGDCVPDEVLAARVNYLIDCITGKLRLSDSGFRHEFSMRIPAELDRDADLVLAELLKRLEKLRRVERAAKNMVQWWDDSGWTLICGPVDEIRTALDGGQA